MKTNGYNKLRILGHLSLLLSLVFCNCIGQGHGDQLKQIQKIHTVDLDTIRERLYKFSAEEIIRQELKTTLSLDSIMGRFAPQNGTWKDIDYQNNSASWWAPAEHWRRLYKLSVCYANNIENKSTAETYLHYIKAGIEYWIDNKPKSTNYWWNAIGIPTYMGRVLVLFRQGELPENMVRAVVDMMRVGIKDQFYDYHGPATGQNLLWLANVHIHLSVLLNDMQGLERAFEEIKSEITYNKKEGIQYDNSFHQHGEQLYSYGYGRVFTLFIAQLAFLAKDTQFEFEKEKIQIISNFILDGQQWMMYKNRPDYSAMGRELARPYYSSKAIVLAAELMAHLSERKQEFLTFIQDYNSGSRLVKSTGNRHFWHSDFMTHKKPGYYASVKMASERINWSEAGNGENLKGYYLGNGVNFIFRRGDEYDSIFPIWNWKKLPGLLSVQDTTGLPVLNWWYEAINTTSFVGGVSNGAQGFAAYDYTKGDLKAKRAWFFFDREIVHLVSGIDYSGTFPLLQTVNQCLSKGEILTSANSQINVLKRPISGKLNWVHHDSIGYFFSGSHKITVSGENKMGNWNTINKSTDKSVVKNVFTIGVELGNNQKNNGSLSYIIVPAISSSKMQHYAKSIDNIAVLSNKKSIQAVHHKPQKQYHLIFYQPGKMALNDSLSIEVDRKSMMLLDYREYDQGILKVATANPENEAQKINVALSAKVSCDNCKWSPANKRTYFSLQTPEKPYSGKTVIKVLEYRK
ncbi:polysaccharide lyase family 8 super-sandwich domain-containing protein [Ulvibacterium marinum]|nr:polysaccharide lyase family 8 super-sandwich domain-containing protein [Ulvibacterium marinum]